jgi:hypothetical protein
MSPDQINAQFGKPVYHCRPCKAETGLHWYRGTSCPVCSKPECTAALDHEWQQAYDEPLDSENF